MIKSILISFTVLNFFAANAQVPVREEPRHHNVFENEYVRLLDVHLGPGDTTFYHLHNSPSVFVFFSKTKTNWQLMGKEATNAPAYSDAGSIAYEDLSAAPKTHRVFNVDSTWYHVMDIELLNAGQNSNATPLSGPAIDLVFDKQQARGYRLTLNNSSAFELKDAQFPYVFISQSTSSIKYMLDKKEYQRSMQPSHFIYVAKGSNIAIRPAEEAKFVVLEIK